MTARSGCRLVEEGPFVHAPLDQVLTGLLIGGPAREASCLRCRRSLLAGDDVVGYAYWFEDAVEWEIGRTYCADCGPDGVSSPTLGLIEVILTGELGMRVFPADGEERLCLSEVRIDRTSPPTEGSEP